MYLPPTGTFPLVVDFAFSVYKLPFSDGICLWIWEFKKGSIRASAIFFLFFFELTKVGVTKILVTNFFFFLNWYFVISKLVFSYLRFVREKKQMNAVFLSFYYEWRRTFQKVGKFTRKRGTKQVRIEFALIKFIEIGRKVQKLKSTSEAEAKRIKLRFLFFSRVRLIFLPLCPFWNEAHFCYSFSMLDVHKSGCAFRGTGVR